MKIQYFNFSQKDINISVNVKTPAHRSAAQWRYWYVQPSVHTIKPKIFF